MSATKKIIIYTTPHCQYCNMAKEYFKQNNVSFTQVDVAADQTKVAELVEKSGQMGVPVIDVDGKIVFGFNKTKLDKLIGLK